MRLFIFFTAAVGWWCLGAELDAQDKSDPQSDAIHALDRAFLSNHSVRLKFQSVDYHKEGNQQREIRDSTLDADLMRDGNKWWVCGKRAARRIKDDGPKEYKGEFEHVISDDQMADITWQDTKKNSPHIFSATFDRSALADSSRVVSLLDPFLFGRSFSNRNSTLAQELTEAQSQGRLTVKQSGLETVLEARDANGQLSIVLAPREGQLVPVRLDLIKGPNDMLGQKRVGDLSGDGGESPTGKMLAYERHINASWGGKPVSLTSYEHRIIRRYTGGDVEKRTVINISGSHAPTKDELNKFVITSAIPNGTPVIIREMSHIAHEWRDGKIQKVLDMSSVEKMSDTRFEQPTPPLFTLSRVVIGLSIFMGLASLGWLVYRRTRAS